MVIRAIVIGKWIKKGWISRSPMLSIEFCDKKLDISPKYYDMKVSMAFYTVCSVRDVLSIPFYYNGDMDKWYPLIKEVSKIEEA